MTTTPLYSAYPPQVSYFSGIDVLGDGCCLSPTVTVMRSHAIGTRRIVLGDGVLLFDHVRLLLGDTRLPVDQPFVLGDGVVVNVGCYLSGEGGLVIEEGVLLGAYCAVLSAGHGIDNGDKKIGNNPITYGSVLIGAGAWLGAHVTVLPNVRIGRGAVIGAGSVVTRDIPDFAVAVGNPARVRRFRQGCGVPWWRQCLVKYAGRLGRFWLNKRDKKAKT